MPFGNGCLRADQHEQHSGPVNGVAGCPPEVALNWKNLAILKEKLPVMRSPRIGELKWVGRRGSPGVCRAPLSCTNSLAQLHIDRRRGRLLCGNRKYVS